MPNGATESSTSISNQNGICEWCEWWKHTSKIQEQIKRAKSQRAKVCAQNKSFLIFRQSNFCSFLNKKSQSKNVEVIRQGGVHEGNTTIISKGMEATKPEGCHQHLTKGGCWKISADILFDVELLRLAYIIYVFVVRILANRNKLRVSSWK